MVSQDKIKQSFNVDIGVFKINVLRKQMFSFEYRDCLFWAALDNYAEAQSLMIENDCILAVISILIR